MRVKMPLGAAPLLLPLAWGWPRLLLWLWPVLLLLPTRDSVDVMRRCRQIKISTENVSMFSIRLACKARHAGLSLQWKWMCVVG
jgi:hypothetical protein